MALFDDTPATLTPLPEGVRAKFCDTLAIDHERQVLYLADNWSGGVDVFDISSPRAKYEATIKLGGRVYGLSVASNVRKLYAGMSGSTLAVVDISAKSLAAQTVASQIITGGRNHVDLLDYEATRERVYAANRMDGLLVTVDAVTDEIVGRTDGLGSGLEQPRFNEADGMIYLTDNRDNVLYQIESESNRLVNRFPIGDPCFPNGLAIDAKANRALLACSNKQRPHTVIWDLERQVVESVIEECGCGDGALYEPSLDRYLFAANGSRMGPVVGIFGGDPVRLLRSVATAKGASWVGYDRKNGVVYTTAIDGGRPALLSFPMPSV